MEKSYSFNNRVDLFQQNENNINQNNIVKINVHIDEASDNSTTNESKKQQKLIQINNKDEGTSTDMSSTESLPLDISRYDNVLPQCKQFSN